MRQIDKYTVSEYYSLELPPNSRFWVVRLCSRPTRTEIISYKSRNI